MVKVLCRGGPYYWVKEPYTEAERAYIQDDGPDPVGYVMDEWLGAGEVYPMTEEEENELYRKSALHPGATILHGPTSLIHPAVPQRPQSAQPPPEEQ
jgi:hypothetical protein